MFTDVKNINGGLANWYVSNFSEKIVERNECPPDIIGWTSFMYGLHEPELGGRPKNLGEYLTHAIVFRLIKKHGIQCLGTSIVEDTNLKNTNLYKHVFKTKEGKEFYAFQFGYQPVASISQLTSSILEMKTKKGCIHCSFEGFADDEHEVECPVCRNGRTRKVLDPLNDILFKNYGWNIFKDVIGEEMAKTLLLLGDCYQSFYKSVVVYCAAIRGQIDAFLQNNKFGVYFDAAVEEVFIRDVMSKIDVEFEGEEDESEDN